MKLFAKGAICNATAGCMFPVTWKPQRAFVSLGFAILTRGSYASSSTNTLKIKFCCELWFCIITGKKKFNKPHTKTNAAQIFYHQMIPNLSVSF